MDEKHILFSHVLPKSWTDNTAKGTHRAVSKGKRLIVINAGGEMGFIPNYPGGKKRGDYHNQIKDNFLQWVQEKLIPNLLPQFVVLTDNAPYHNVEINKSPT